jgi:hypothetical protein
VGYNGRGFFPLWDTMEKNIQRRMIFLNFKCLSSPSNKNFGKINYLNCQTNPWRENQFDGKKRRPKISWYYPFKAEQE